MSPRWGLERYRSGFLQRCHAYGVKFFLLPPVHGCPAELDKADSQVESSWPSNARRSARGQTASNPRQPVGFWQKPSHRAENPRSGAANPWSGGKIPWSGAAAPQSGGVNPWVFPAAPWSDATIPWSDATNPRVFPTAPRFGGKKPWVGGTSRRVGGGRRRGDGVRPWVPGGIGAPSFARRV